MFVAVGRCLFFFAHWTCWITICQVLECLRSDCTQLSMLVCMCRCGVNWPLHCLKNTGTCDLPLPQIHPMALQHYTCCWRALSFNFQNNCMMMYAVTVIKITHTVRCDVVMLPVLTNTRPALMFICSTSLTFAMQRDNANLSEPQHRHFKFRFLSLI